MNTKSYKRPGAIEKAHPAEQMLDAAINDCHEAEESLYASGHKRAAQGVHQIALRLTIWRDKVHDARVDASIAAHPKASERAQQTPPTRKKKKTLHWSDTQRLYP